MTPLPPYAQLLKLRAASDDDGAPLFVMPFDDDVMGRPGFLHGGAIAGLLEFAAFATLRRALGEAEVVMKPINVTVDYMRGGHPRDTFAAATIDAAFLPIGVENVCATTSSWRRSASGSST